MGFADVPSPGFGAIGLLSPVVPEQLNDVARQGKAPPLVLVVGAADEVVGSAPVVALADAAKAGGVDVQLDVVAGQGHGWLGDGGAAGRRPSSPTVSPPTCSRSSLGCVAERPVPFPP